MKQYNYFFGVDVSKKTVDITLLHQQQFTHFCFGNNDEGMEALKKWLKQLKNNLCDTIFCMEATGLYCYPLTVFLAKNSIDTWVEHASLIKNSSAFERGKNDKVDSKRIATYCSKNLDRIRLWQPLDSTIEKIKHLASLRERLVETQKRLLTPLKEFDAVGNKEMSKLIAKTMKKSYTAVMENLKTVEAEIMKIINESRELKQLYEIIISVVGIGFVTAVNLIIHTNGFSMLNETRKLACYCGVAPFQYSSGTSVRKRTRVHHMANKKLKCNLHMASLTAVKLDADLKQYYERKVKEGKNKMSVLNAVKNKLLARVVVCVNNQRQYVKKTA